MSGGSLDYAYEKVNDAAFAINDRSRRPLHLAFAEHLTLVSKALHDLEWELAGDYSAGNADASIRKILDGGLSVAEGAKAAHATLKEMRREIVESLAIVERAIQNEENPIEPLYIQSRDLLLSLRLVDEDCGEVDFFAEESLQGWSEAVGGTLGFEQVEAIHRWAARWLARQDRKIVK